MAVKAVVSKAVKKAVEKGGQTSGKHGKAKKGFDRHGLFLFETDCNLQESLESSKVDRTAHERQMLQLMYMYQTYHNIVQISQYASRGSKLVCQYGTKPALLDTLEDHGVYAGTRPVMTCADCERVNLHDFGSCMCPERFYENRLPMTVPVHRNGIPAKQAPYNKYPHICVPLVNAQKGWYQAETGVFVEESNGTAYQALLDRAFLVCQYGGMITIPEVPVDEVDITQDKTVKRYVVLSDATRVRETPEVNDHNKIAELKAGVRVNVIGDKRETENTDKGIRYWAEIEYEHENGETAWISDENILPDEPVITDKFVEEVIVTQTNNNGRIEEEWVRPVLTNWYTSGDSKVITTSEELEKYISGAKRYGVAIGARIMNPKYPNGGGMLEDDFKIFDRNIEVVIKSKIDENEQEISLPCYVRVWKGHTYYKYKDPDYLKEYDENKIIDYTVTTNVESGIYQTGIRYPCGSKNLKEWADENVDGSVIEFWPNKDIVEKVKGIELQIGQSKSEY